MTSSDWTLRDAQDAVDDWITQWEEGYWPPLSNLARLTEEVGELARELNEVHGDKPADAPSRPERIADEMGDILFVLITLANSMDIDLEAALRQVLSKYGVRDSHRFTRRKPGADAGEPVDSTDCES